MKQPCLFFILLSLIVAATACTGGGKSVATAGSETSSQPAATVAFDADSAMSFLKAQTDMGPRVPGTEAHERCGDYLVNTLKRFGADTVIEQRVNVTAWNGDHLPLRNILARFNQGSGSEKPVLLVAHWDTRPWADADADPACQNSPIDGANDGASGVAVLLEIARQASMNGTKMPIEILFADGEDYGSHDDHGSETTWCLGTQQWLMSSPYADSQAPRYAILLDMVGGSGARFHREYISDTYAKRIVDMVWNLAASLGMADRFVNQMGSAVVDDHLFINRSGIPAIDIIESQNPDTGTFNPTWHTHHDNYENIDPATIGDTGRLIANLVIKPQ